MTAKHPELRPYGSHLELERLILGGVLMDPTLLRDLASTLNAGSFTKPSHATLWRTLLALDAAGQRPDLAIVVDALDERALQDVGGLLYLTGLPTACPTIEAVPTAAERLRQHATRRRLSDHALQLHHAARAEVPVDELVALAEGVTEITRTIGDDDPVHVGPDVLVTVAAVIERRRERQQAEREGRDMVVGLTSGWPELDRLLGGFRPGQLIYLGARPAMGKTALALNVARAALEAGVAVLMFSYEMTRQELIERLLASIAGVFYDRITDGRTDPEDERKLEDAAEWLASQPLYVEDRSDLPFVQLCARARRTKHRLMGNPEGPQLGLVVCDYVQLIPLGTGRKGASTNDLLGEISRGLKGLAKELKAPVFALAQLNRDVEKRTDKHPMVSDLRDSGSLEADADKILLLYRDEVYNPDTSDRGIAEVGVPKNRGGKTGVVRLSWAGAFQRFDSLDVAPQGWRAA